MNESKLLEDVARALASSMPRRQAVQWIVRGVVGAVVSSVFWPGRAFADPTPKKGTCPPNHTLCGNVTCCPPPKACCVNVCCQPHEVCQDGRCKKQGSPSGGNGDRDDKDKGGKDKGGKGEGHDGDGR